MLRFLSLSETAKWRYYKCQMATTITSRIQQILGGRAVLGGRITSQRDLANVARSGLPYSSLASITRMLDISAESLASALALPKRTLARRKTESKLTAIESDRVLRLARVVAAAVDVLGSGSKASRWLQRPNRALGNETPLSQMDTDAGVRMVEQLLGRIEHGVFS